MGFDPRPSFDAMVAALRARDESLSMAGDYAWKIALLLRENGRVALARKHLEHALAELSALSIDDVYRCWIHIELCELLRHAGVWDRAREHMDAARASLFGETADPFETPTPPGRLDLERPIAFATWFDVAGQFYMQLGRTEIAAKYFEEQERRALEVGETSLWWGALDNELRLAYLLRDYEGIERLWREAREHPFWQRARREERGHIDLTVARSFLEAERLGLRERGEAFEMLIELVQDENVHPFEAFAAELLLASTLLDEGLPEEAQGFLDAARDRRSAWGETRFEGGRALFALTAIEWRAARISGDPERIARAFADSHEIFATFLESWASAPPAPDGTGFLQAPWHTAFLAELLELHLAHVADREEAARSALDKLLAVQELGSFSRATHEELPRLDSRFLLSELPHDAGHAFVTYVQGHSRSLAFVAGAGEVAVFEVADAARIEAAQRRLRGRAFDAARGLTSDHRPLAAALRDARETLLPEKLARELLRWERLTLVGADGSGLFAFEALPIDGQPLGVLRPIDHIASFPIAGWLAARTADAPPSPASIHIVFPGDTAGAPARFAHLEPIPYSPEHVARLRAHYGAARVSAGPRARLAALTDAGDHAAWTFLTHGLFDPERPRPEGLLLEGGDVLWGELVEELSAPPVVTLIACGAGHGLVRKGDDGRSHLGNGFLRAGARAVLFSSLDLSYRSGLALDEHVHARLTAGDSPAEALRSARERLIAEGLAGPLGIQALAVRFYGAGHSPLRFAAPGPGPAPNPPPEDGASSPSSTTPDTVRRDAERPSSPVPGLVLGALALTLLGWGVARWRRSPERHRART